MMINQVEGFEDEHSLEFDEIQIGRNEIPRHRRRYKKWIWFVSLVLIVGAAGTVAALYGHDKSTNHRLSDRMASSSETDITVDCTMRQRVVQKATRTQFISSSSSSSPPSPRNNDVMFHETICETQAGGMYHVSPSLLTDDIREQYGEQLKHGHVKVQFTHVNKTLDTISAASPDSKATIFVQESRRRRRKLGGDDTGSSSSSLLPEQANSMGTKTLLVLRVVSKDGHADGSMATISNKFFGTNGDPVNVASIYKGCSYGQMEIVPATGSGITDGVGQIHLGNSRHVTGMDTVAVENLVLSTATKKYGRLGEQFDFVAICLPSGAVDIADAGGWGTISYMKHWLSMFNDEWCGYSSAQAHAIGTNINLEYSYKDGEYGDQSGLMGFSYKYSDIPLMCFNGAKNWFLGWYQDRQVSVQLDNGGSPFVGTLVSFTDYEKAVDSMFVLLQFREYYIQYNRAEDMNADTQAMINEVSITFAPELADASFSITGLSDENPTFVVENYDDDGHSAIVEFCFAAVRRGSIDAAQVAIYLRGERSPCGSHQDWLDEDANQSCKGDNEKFQVADEYACSSFAKHVSKDELSSMCLDPTFAANCCKTCGSVDGVAPSANVEAPTSSVCIDDADYKFGHGQSCTHLTTSGEMPLLCSHIREVSVKCCASCADTSEQCYGDDANFTSTGLLSCSDLDKLTDSQKLADLCTEDTIAQHCCSTCGRVSHVTPTPPTAGGGVAPPPSCVDNGEFLFGSRGCANLKDFDEFSVLCNHVDDVGENCCASCHYSKPPGAICDGDNPAFTLGRFFGCSDIAAEVPKQDLAGFCSDARFLSNCCQTCDAVSHIGVASDDGSPPYNPDGDTCEDDPDYRFGGQSCVEISASDRDETVFLCDKVNEISSGCCATCKTNHEQQQETCSDTPTFEFGGYHTCASFGQSLGDKELAGVCLDRIVREQCCSTCKSVADVEPPGQPQCVDRKDFYFGGATCSRMKEGGDLVLLCAHLDDISQGCCQSCVDVDGIPLSCEADDENFRMAGSISCNELSENLNNQDLADFCDDDTIGTRCCETCAAVSHLTPSKDKPVTEVKPPPEGCLDSETFSLGGKACIDLRETRDFHFLCETIDSLKDGCCASCHAEWSTKSCHDDSGFRIGPLSCSEIAAEFPKKDLAQLCSEKRFQQGCCSTCATVEHLPTTYDGKPPFKPDENDRCEDDSTFQFAGPYSCSDLLQHSVETFLLFCDHVDDFASSCCSSCKSHHEESTKCKSDDETFALGGFGCEDYQNLRPEELGALCHDDHSFRSRCCKTCSMATRPSPTKCEDTPGIIFAEESCSSFAHSGDLGVFCQNLEQLQDSCCASCVEHDGAPLGCVSDNSEYTFAGHSCQDLSNGVNNHELADLCSHTQELAEGCCITCASVSHVEAQMEFHQPSSDCKNDNTDFRLSGSTCRDMSKDDNFQDLCLKVLDVADNCCQSCKSAIGSEGKSCKNNPSFLFSGKMDCEEVVSNVSPEEFAGLCTTDGFKDNCCASCDNVAHIKPGEKASPHQCVDSTLYSWKGHSCTELAKSTHFLMTCQTVEDVGSYCCASCKDAADDAAICDGDDDDFQILGNLTCADISGQTQRNQDLSNLCTDRIIKETCCESCKAVDPISKSQVPDTLGSSVCSQNVDNMNFTFSHQSCTELAASFDDMHFLCKTIRDVASNCCSSCARAVSEPSVCSDNSNFKFADHFSCFEVKESLSIDELAQVCEDRSMKKNCCSSCNSVANHISSVPQNQTRPYNCEDDEMFQFGPGLACADMDSVMCSQVTDVSRGCCKTCREIDSTPSGCSGNDPRYRLDGFSCDDVDKATSNNQMAGLCNSIPEFARRCCKSCGAVSDVNYVPEEDHDTDASICVDNDSKFGQMTCSEIVAGGEIREFCSHVDGFSRMCCASCEESGVQEPGDFCQLNDNFRYEGSTCQEMNDFDEKLLAVLCQKENDVAKNCCLVCADVVAMGGSGSFGSIDPVKTTTTGDFGAEDARPLDSATGTGTVKIDACGENRIHFQLDLMTDDWPKDTQWTLYDIESNILRSSPEYDKKNQLTSYSECLDASNHYVFKIEDGSLDGICCNHGFGYYTVLVDGKAVYSGGEFLREEQVIIAPDCERSDEARIVIDLTTDFFSSETSYLLSYHNDDIPLVSKDGFDSFERYVDSRCVKQGCYEFSLDDAAGNGLCCDYGRGGYSVIYDDVVVVSSEFELGSKEVTTFGDCNSGSTPKTEVIANQGSGGDESDRNAYLDFVKKHAQTEMAKKNATDPESR